MQAIFRMFPILLAALVVSCERHEPVVEAAAPPPGEDPVVFATRVTAAAFAALSGRLGEAMADGGPVVAIDVCSVEAEGILDGVAAEHGVRVRRVTDRPRNPANQADAGDLELMEMIRTMIAAGDEITPHVAGDAAAGTIVRLPIRIAMPLCLACHGDTGADVAPDTLAAIRNRYPHDRATGYREGELRGLWRVEIPEIPQP